MRFAKYHGLGNDYIVIHPAELKDELSKEEIRLICHRNYGIGSDGILVGPLESALCDFGLKIFNPDGSEAEKSGNGLRIFARWIVDESLSNETAFSVETAGGAVSCVVSADRKSVEVEMGKVSFDSSMIPVAGAEREVLNEMVEIDGRNLRFCAATVGNPHCVVFSEQPSRELAERYGPLLENHPLFPNRTNVQFMKVIDRSIIAIEIWERGAGYTLASGSSSAAASAVAYRLGYCDSHTIVIMPGGQIEVQIKDDYSATITGPAGKICDGNIAAEMFDKLT